MKRLIAAQIAFALTMFIYWLGGGDFERGEPLAFTVVVGLVLAGAAATFPEQPT